MSNISRLRRAKMTLQGGRCYYCDLPMWEAELCAVPGTRRAKALRCTAEHLQPRSEGGADGSDNIVAACQFCNAARHKCNPPRQPEAHRAHVRKRMRQGRWLSALRHSETPAPLPG